RDVPPEGGRGFRAGNPADRNREPARSAHGRRQALTAFPLAPAAEGLPRRASRLNPGGETCTFARMKTIESFVGNTPLVRLQRMPGRTSNVVLAKLEGNNPAGSVKDRPAL